LNKTKILPRKGVIMKFKTFFPYTTLFCCILMLIISPSNANAKGEPYFGVCQVMAMNTPDGITTLVVAKVFDPNGTIPTTINSIAVSGPNGFSYSFTTGDYIAYTNEYWSKRPELPVEGEYTFTVKDNEGKTATSHCYLEVGNTIPLPDDSSLQASGDPLPTTLSWGAISNYQGNLFYRTRIYDMSDNTIWTSNNTTGTATNVPSGILSSGTDYQWRVEAFDEYHSYASNNRAVCEKIPLAVDNTSPFFTYAVVYKRLDSDGIWTALEFRVIDPNGTVPNTINSITVTGPGGFSQTLGKSDYDPAFNEYYRIVSGSPTDGIYTFTVTDSDGRTATTYDYVAASNVPFVAINTFQASGNSLSPRLSWSVPSYNGSSIYFRVRIIDTEGNPVWSSGRISSTSETVPSGILQEGVSYRWQVRTGDSRYWVHYNVESRTDFVDLAIDNSPPNFYYAFVYNRRQPDGFFTILDVRVGDPNGSLPDSIASLNVTGPGGFSYDLQPQDYDPVWDTYYHLISGKPQSGVYTFTIKDNEANTLVTHDYCGASDDIPPFDESTFFVSGDPLTPTVSWGGISGYQGRLHYRLVIADAQDQNIWFYWSGRELYTAQTVPNGRLEKGKSYLFRVEAYDHRDWIIYNNRLNSNWFPLSTSKAMPWIPLLLLDD
jgi:hypothetical protein